MGYVERNLMAGEDVLLRPRYHPVRFLPGALGIFLGVLVALGTVVLPPGTASPGEDGPVVFRRIQNPEAFRNVALTRRATPAAASIAPTTLLRTAEDRLKDVERLFKTGSLTEGEYKLKRQELIKEL
jgi:hypothetical protein